jgi:hypothetical protein
MNVSVAGAFQSSGGTSGGGTSSGGTSRNGTSGGGTSGNGTTSHNGGVAHGARYVLATAALSSLLTLSFII